MYDIKFMRNKYYETTRYSKSETGSNSTQYFMFSKSDAIVIQIHSD